MSINYVWQMMHTLSPKMFSLPRCLMKQLMSDAWIVLKNFFLNLQFIFFYNSNSAQLQVLCSAGDKKYSSPLSLPLRLLHLGHVV